MQWWLIAYLPLGGKYAYKVFHGTQADAEAQAQLAVNGKVLGPYATQADAQAAEKAQKPNPNAKPVISVPGVNGLLTGVNAIGDFFQRLTQGNTWIRVGEVVAGLILLGIGLNSMLKGKPLQIVTKGAGVVGKAAML